MATTTRTPRKATNSTTSTPVETPVEETTPEVTETPTEETSTTEETPKTRLQDREPTARTVALAKFILDTTGVEVSPKQVQVVLGLAETFSKTETAKALAADRAKAAERAEEKKRKALQEKIAKLQAQLEGK